MNNELWWGSSIIPAFPGRKASEERRVEKEALEIEGHGMEKFGIHGYPILHDPSLSPYKNYHELAFKNR